LREHGRVLHPAPPICSRTILSRAIRVVSPAVTVAYPPEWETRPGHRAARPRRRSRSARSRPPGPAQENPAWPGSVLAPADSRAPHPRDRSSLVDLGIAKLHLIGVHLPSRYCETTPYCIHVVDGQNAASQPLDLRGTHNLQDRTVASGTNAWNYNWLRIWSCNCCTSFNNLSTLAGRPCRYHVVVVDLMSGASCRSAGRPRSLGSNQQGVRGDLAARAATNGFGYSSSLSGSLATCLLSFHWTVRQHRQHWRDRASWARPSAA